VIRRALGRFVIPGVATATIAAIAVAAMLAARPGRADRDNCADRGDLGSLPGWPLA